MGNKLYVGGLPYSVTEGRLEEVFAPHGTVASARLIADKFTGQSRGFGFVEMSSSAEAQSAIDALKGTQLDGRTLVVNEAKPMERRDGGGSRDGNGGGRGRNGGQRGETGRAEKAQKGATVVLPPFFCPRSATKPPISWAINYIIEKVLFIDRCAPILSG